MIRPHEHVTRDVVDIKTNGEIGLQHEFRTKRVTADNKVREIGPDYGTVLR